jgi:hypothetical protein
LLSGGRRAGIVIDIEPNHLSHDRKRPDIIFYMKGGMCIVDVAAAHGLTLVRVNAEIGVDSTDVDSDSERSDGGSAESELDLQNRLACHLSSREKTLEAVELAKRRKYKELIRDHGATFTTAAVETTGGLGKELRELLDQIGHEAMSNQIGWSKDEVITGVQNAVAVAIQVGNARLIQDNRTRIVRSKLEEVKGAEGRQARKGGTRRRGKSRKDLPKHKDSSEQKDLSEHKESTNPPHITSSQSNRPATVVSLPSSFSVASACLR